MSLEILQKSLETASIKTIENGVMTKDLAQLSEVSDIRVVNTEEFLKEVKKTLDSML